MQKFITAAMAAAFATGSTLAILAGSAQQSAQSYPGFFSSSPAIAAADEDDQGENNDRQNNDREKGNRNRNNCYNPAGHERGRCKHNGRNGRNGGYNRGTTTVTGTIQSINGSTVYFLRDNGQPLTFIDNNGTRLSVGQRVTLRLYNYNGQYSLAPNGNNNGYGNNGYGNGGYNNGQSNRQVGGVILAVSGSTLTFINGTAIDISQAQQRGAINGNLSTGRSITAYGYVDSNNYFHATSIR